MRGRKQLQRLHPAAFLVFARKSPEPLPDRRLDDGHRNPTQCDRRFNGATARPYFRNRRCRPALAWPAARSMKACWTSCCLDPCVNCDRIDALFGVRADDRRSIASTAARRCAVLNGDDGQSTVNTGIDARTMAFRGELPLVLLGVAAEGAACRSSRARIASRITGGCRTPCRRAAA